MKPCKVCSTEFKPKNVKNTLCSEACKKIQRSLNQKAFTNARLSSNEETVECAICNRRMQALSGHVSKAHGITMEQYREKYSGKTLVDSVSKKISELNSGENNPGYQHGGKLSPFSDKSEVHTKEQREMAVARAQLSKTPDKHPTRIEYYLAQGMSETEASAALSERQTTFSKAKCIEKHGIEEGTKVFADRQKKWQSNFPRGNFSMVSQELFWKVCEKHPTLETIHFAELGANKSKDDSGKNNELVLSLSETTVRPDFIDVKQKKIIEFDGDYWHSEARGNLERDTARDKMLIAEGYQVLHIKERDYRKDMEGEVSKCINFLIEWHG